ncbi:BsuPI-related putative proteinase inhibitor [Ferdinandcohnia sp. Marseille-Q9671]
MKRKRIFLYGGITLIVLVLLVFGLQEARVDQPKQETNSMKVESESEMQEGRKKIARQKLELFGMNKLETSISKQVEKNLITIVFDVHNKGDKDIHLQFPSAQQYDYEIYNQKGELVHRYSDDKVFAQVIKNVLLPVNQSLSFTATLPTLEKGEYTLSFWINARGLTSLKEELLFEVE